MVITAAGVGSGLISTIVRTDAAERQPLESPLQRRESGRGHGFPPRLAQEAIVVPGRDERPGAPGCISGIFSLSRPTRT